MGWGSAIKKPAPAVIGDISQARFDLPVIDWDRLVTLDFETYYDQDYTLKKMSTSEYVRDKRFKAQMLGLKIGRKKTRTFTGAAITMALRSINWAMHTLLAHNCAFDGFILSHHYGIVPKYYFDSLSMARGLHSNEIGAGLEEVSVYYGGDGKIKDVLETTLGVLNWDRALIGRLSPYCAQDTDECYRVFTEMAKVYPDEEMDLINMTIRMFCDPVLRLDVPRAQAEYEREVAKRRELLLGVAPNLDEYDRWEGKKYVGVLDKKSGRDDLEGDDRKVAVAKKVIGSNEKFVKLLHAAGIPDEAVPYKLSPAWMKLDKEERERQSEKKWSYAFAKDDLNFIDLPERVWEIRTELNPNKTGDVIRATTYQETWRNLVDTRLAVKSTTNITRAQRFLESGRNGMRLPVGYRYAAAHTLRFGGADKRNYQNLTRGGELRKSIMADKGHVLAVCDSGQIEARVNGWLWDQDDLLDAFRKSDSYEREMEGIPEAERREMRLDERDAYCRFGDEVYGRPIWKKDKEERFISKVCVLGLGFGMSDAKFQMTLARGAMGGPRVNFTRDHCSFIVRTYRSKNYRIVQGWKLCGQIIEDMAAGVSGQHKCLTWGGDGEGNGWVMLPNGMSLKYPDLRKSRNDETGWDEWTYRSGDVRKKIYGSLLTENFVQALARIIVMTQMLWIDAKYRVVMTTHDEVVAHPRKREAEKCYQFMHQCMTTPLWWCPDIPLAAEGGWADNYSK